MSDEKKEIFRKESGSTFVEYEGTTENIPSIKPLYYDATYDPNPWPVKENDYLRRLSLNDKFVNETTKKLDHNKIQQDYITYHNEFRKKSILTKLGLIIWYLPSYVWYNYLAPKEDSQLYKSLKWFLDFSRKQQDNFIKND